MHWLGGLLYLESYSCSPLFLSYYLLPVHSWLLHGNSATHFLSAHCLGRLLSALQQWGDLEVEGTCLWSPTTRRWRDLPNESHGSSSSGKPCISDPHSCDAVPAWGSLWSCVAPRAYLPLLLRNQIKHQKLIFIVNTNILLKFQIRRLYLVRCGLISFYLQRQQLYN